MAKLTTATPGKKRLMLVAFIVVILASALFAALGYHYLTYRNTLMQNAVVRSGQMSVRVCAEHLEQTIVGEENRLVLEVAFARPQPLDAQWLERINQRYPLIDRLFVTTASPPDTPLQRWLVERVQQQAAAQRGERLVLHHVSGVFEGQPVQAGFLLLPRGFIDDAPRYLIFTLNLDFIRTRLLPQHQRSLDDLSIREHMASSPGGSPDPFVVAASFRQILPFWTLSSQIDNHGMTDRARMEFVIYSTLIVFLFGLILLSVYFIWRQVHHEKKLSQVKSQMVSHVSHELKTPLSLIRMYTETLLLGRVAAPEKIANYYRIILGECDHLHLLINNTLDFSCIEKGMKEYRFTRGNLAEIVQHIVAQYHDYLSQQGVTIRVVIAPDLPDCRFDPLAVSQVIGNLLDNAIKFSPEQKNISLALSHQGGVIKLEVADHGVGMPADKIDTIFAPYARLTNTFRGSGIGLSLVKHAIDAHGGAIEVLSTLGEGSTFIVTLPVMEAEDDA